MFSLFFFFFLIKSTCAKSNKFIIFIQEKECLELRKGRDKEEEQLSYVFSKNKVKDVDVHSSKSTNL
jgi:hypothetical protein